MVTIKGIRDGLLVTLGGGDWNHLLAELEDRLDRAANFFTGARVALQVGPLALSTAEIAAVRDLLARKAITLWAVVSESATTQEAARQLELDIALPSHPSTGAEIPDELSTEATDLSAVLVHRTLRSGQSLRNVGHVVLIGDVNPGAEIIAGGDVVVWGKLRGTVHAGAMGDDSRVVCALELTPTQLRIGSLVARSPDERRRRVRPEMARVNQGQIVVEPWDSS
ncbi:MAG: septum site-determining protein MinC [Anaerolineae bacterium]|jgi:septum site-determining protein MinC|nr:septum site-determining protein MinC [Anaerolineae bacterium]MDH7474611.1 septum site-determining protein MinC [Anaerolineae bacterium]